MRLTTHDVTAPALTLAGAALVWADAAGTPLPGLGGPRVLGAAVLALGIASCAAGGGAPGTPNGYQNFVGLLGTAAFVLGLVTIATGSAGTLRALTGLLLGIAALSTIRRAVQPPRDRPPPDEAPGHPRRRYDREPVGGRR